MFVRNLGVIGCALSMAVLTAATPAAAQDAVLLEPTSPWAIEYADDSCRLYRTFGSGPQQVVAGLTSYEPGGRFELSAVGELTKTFSRPDTVKIAIGDIESFGLRYLQVDFDGTPGLLIMNKISIGPLPEGVNDRLRNRQPVKSVSDPAIEEQVKTIGFVDGLEQEFILHTGSMKEPMNVLRECTEELITHWDIDVEAHDDLQRVASPQRPRRPWL